MQAGGRAVSIIGVIATAHGCIDQLKPLTPDDVCASAGYSVAARTMECQGDEATAVARYEAVQALPCRAEWPELNGGDEHLTCAVSLGALPCPTVEALGDDIEGWLAIEPSCGLVFGADASSTADTGSLP